MRQERPSGGSQREGGHRPRAPRGNPPPRREAIKPDPRRPRRRVAHRLRARQERNRAGGTHRLRGYRGDDRLSGTGAARGRRGRAERCLLSGRNALRDARPAAGVPRLGPAAPPAEGRRGSAGPAPAHRPRHCEGPGDDRPQGHGARARPPLRFGGRDERRPRSLPPRGADRRPARWARGPLDPLVPPVPVDLFPRRRRGRPASEPPRRLDDLRAPPSPAPLRIRAVDGARPPRERKAREALRKPGGHRAGRAGPPIGRTSR